MTPEQRTEQKRARYLKLIALRDRIDKIADKAAGRIHSHEKLNDFWAGVKKSTEIVAAWPAWKRDIGRQVMGDL